MFLPKLRILPFIFPVLALCLTTSIAWAAEIPGPGQPPPSDDRDLHVSVTPVLQSTEERAAEEFTTVNLVISNKGGGEVENPAGKFIERETCYVIETGDDKWDGDGNLVKQGGGVPGRDICYVEGNPKDPSEGPNPIPEEMLLSNFLIVESRNEKGEIIEEQKLRVIARLICTNGEGPRTNCGKKFSRDLLITGQYTVRIWKAVKYTDDPEKKHEIERYEKLMPSNANGDGWIAVRFVPGKTPLEGDVPEPRFGDKLDTGLGEIPTNALGLAQRTYEIAIGIGGGVAFLLMVFGAYRLIFSAGNPDAIMQGREVITAAIIGLVIIIASVFLLRLVGISIFGIPLQ